jgi:pyruvate dehydrogenase E2 component (dihydrolipoamide acetyltransferase)
MSDHVFALPDVGEGLTEAEILRWLVAPGDDVTVNQMLVEIETAKAAVELPSPFAGRITHLHADEGQVVAVGSPIVTIATQAGSAASATAPAAAEAAREPVLVGYGVGGSERRRRRVAADPAPVANPAVTADAAPDHTTATRPRAKPLVRKLARDAGVDLSRVPGTGRDGEVTRADLLAYGGRRAAPAAVRPIASDEVHPVRGVQRTMAEAMVASAFTAPHVTEWVDVDVSRTVDLVARLRAAHPDVKVTPMTIAAAGLVRAALRHPRVNSTWVDTPDGAEVHMHGSVHLGIAADTPRGLVVPTVRDASSLGLLELAARIRDLVETARAGRSTPADLTGGTITLTNVGVFGVDGGTPIINPGQSSILAVGRVIERPWVVVGQVVARPVMTLSYSFDHRVIDGALGSRVLRAVADFLEDPAVALVVDP